MKTIIQREIIIPSIEHGGKGWQPPKEQQKEKKKGGVWLGVIIGLICGAAICN